jgi:seryl-tRNA synthetase
LSVIEVSSLRSENARLQQELAGLQAERDHLESSIGELDEQHQQATETLISARNGLQSQLAESHKQVKKMFFLFLKLICIAPTQSFQAAESRVCYSW